MTRKLYEAGVVILGWFIANLLGVAAVAEQKDWGLLNFYDFPFLVTVIIAVVAMDFVIWLQHVMVHAIPILWRLHRVHHADLDYDVTTGARFHTVEIILSMLIKFATIMVLGPPVVAVVGNGARFVQKDQCLVHLSGTSQSLG